MFKACILVICGLLFAGAASAQRDTSDVYSYAFLAEKMHKNKSYDSAINTYQSAWALIRKQDLQKDVIATIVLHGIGQGWHAKNNYLQAHTWYTMALENARKFDHHSEKALILPDLVNLHSEIVSKDILFPYPAVSETEEDNLFVQLGKIEDAGDSLLITIPAGKWDGIVESGIRPQVYTHISGKDTAGHNEINYFSTARIISIGNNQTRIKTGKHETIKLLPGDFVIMRANLPLLWRKLSLRDFLTRNLYFRDNYNQRLFDYRYFYYYADSILEEDVLEVMKASVNEVVEAYGADTLTNAQFGTKATAGIFTGMNLMKAIVESKPEHLRYFLNYVSRYPGKYTGNNFKFSETFATWIINSTPLVHPDIRAWLLSFPSGMVRQQRAAWINAQIAEEELIDKWLDEGMRLVGVEDINGATQTATLVRDVLIGTKDIKNAGWTEYLFANIARRMDQPDVADSLLDMASRKFNDAGNREGPVWIKSTREQWKRHNSITVGVQNGHLFPYIIAEPGDSRYFATGGKDNLVKIWDKTLGKEILTLNEHRDEINALAYSPNGRYLASTSQDSTICIWNAYNNALLHKFIANGPVRAAVFTPDNLYLVCAGEDSVIRFRDVQSGAVIKELRQHKGIVTDLAFHPGVDTWLYSSGTDSFIYKWDLDTGEMIRWYRQQGQVLDLGISSNGKYMNTISTDSSFTVWNLESNRKLVWGKIHTYKPGNTAFYASGSFSPDSRYFAYPYKKDSFNIIDLKDLYERMYPTNQEKYLNLADMKFSKDGVSLFARFDMGGPMRIYNFAGWDIRNNTTLTWKDIKPFSNLTVGIQFTNDDNGLIIQHSEIGKLDLRNASYEMLYSGASMIMNAHLLLEDEQVGTWFDLTKPTLNLYNHRERKVVKSFSLPAGEKISTFVISPGDEFVYMAGENGNISGWDRKSGKHLFSRQYTKGEDRSITRLIFDPYQKRLFAITEQDMLLVLQPQTGDITATIPGIAANDVAVSPDIIFITTGKGFLYKYDARTLKEQKRIRVNKKEEGAYQVVLSPDQKFLVLQNTFSSLMGIDPVTDSILFNIHDHDYGGTMIAISHDSKRIATAGFDSRINLLDIRTGKRIVSVNMPMDRGPVITDTLGHYLASRNALDAITFSYNNNAYSFDQFDLQLNRPDIILARIGRADTTLLQSYYAAFKKRLKRLQVDENSLGKEMHLPRVRIKDKFALQPVTTNKTFTIQVECSDSRYALASVQVLVNNCPLLGMTGTPLSGMQTVREVSIPLSEGENDIKVYCTNEKGVSSLRESLSVISKYKKEKPAITWFIGIGVANYKDKKMNLGYSVKDIRDLARTFDRFYADVRFDTLLDAAVTRENILALKKKLQETSVNDRVILAVTGHGLLSDSLDFYYATWDVDFQKPEARGLRYEELENLLTDIPARQKLMLIDACHSGALDKEELLALKKDSTITTVVKADKDSKVKGRAPRGLVVGNKDAKMNANSSFEMMQRLFSDLSVSNGAVIISAAGGMEFAFESGKWNNGVFTYCVRKGIEEKLADTDGGNYDGKVSVQELLKYVSRKVSELTGGKQKPTSRRENVEYEWMIRH